MEDNKPTIFYNAELAKATVKISQYKKKLNQLSVLRLTAFLVLVASLYTLGPININHGIVAGIVFFILFIYLVIKYLKVQKQLLFEENFKTVVANEIIFLQNGSNLYSAGEVFENPQHPYTDDLDIFGNASIFHFINRCSTNRGNLKLAELLSKYSEKVVIEQRQQAVQELEKHFQDSLWFRAKLLLIESNLADNIIYAIKHHFNALLKFTQNKWLTVYAKIAPALIIVLVVVVIAFNLSWKIALPVLMINSLLSLWYSKTITLIHEAVGKRAKQLQTYSELIKWIENGNWKSDSLKTLVNACKSKSEKKAYYKIAELAKLVQLLEYRLNMVVGAFLNIVFLWDIRCAYKLQNWYNSSSDDVVEGLNVIGEFEAIISLSTLNFNYLDWIFPEIKTGYVFETKGIGHPLILKNRIYNDFTLTENKTVDVITGSNMAGKSTFLRTVGVNMVLAYAGAPVCCQTLVLSPFRLVTYMRIKDSLNESTSTFKAEINRLKMILDETVSYETTFALIDEMLRGTNSRDKFLGTKVFIEKFISQNSAAIIATHDLQVAELAKEHPQQVRNFHFDIQTDGTEMFFDYKIKDGECKTFNASILLKQIGLNIEV